jgi:hypothetical protein
MERLLWPAYLSPGAGEVAARADVALRAPPMRIRSNVLACEPGQQSRPNGPT